ncbi:NADH-quinone oxidoreductase subunit C [Glycomyces arizonensis]|uniref:NADH-quinone oxidoreductase subunit C n=1 Tax=Glycomyces arizonensis TaxID=256035 RepID=UPI0003FA65DB|nr:NADH-quinone oxidoreductase subunit C [Glycomyces arizonensis]
MADPWEDRVRDALGTEELALDGARAVVDVPARRWRESVRICRDELGCDFFDWLSAVDESEIGSGSGVKSGTGSEGKGGSGVERETEDSGPQIRIVAHLWSIAARRGVLLRTAADGPMDTVTGLYPGASWHERETHEMFGVDFTGHPNLAPLLLPPEFEGHPLRKDFVLASRVVKPWPGEKEPGGGREGARKRAPKRPPGVPENWGRSDA